MMDLLRLFLRLAIPLFNKKRRRMEVNRAAVIARVPHLAKANWWRLPPHSAYRELVQNLAADLSSLICGRPPSLLPMDQASKDALLSLQNGGLLLSAHLGNHELVAREVGLLVEQNQTSLLSAAEPMRSASIQRLLDRRRRSWNAEAIHLKGELPRAVDHLRNGGVFGVMIDQDPGVRGSETSFLGHPCRTTKLADLLWKRSGYPVAVVGFAITGSRAGEGKGHLLFRKLDRSSPPTAQAHLFLEKLVLEEPALWYGWIHRRFKSTAPELYR